MKDIVNKRLIIVESPGKIKTISSYLGKDYAVIASSGHVRQLSSKSGSVKLEQDKFSFVWEDNTAKIKNIYKHTNDLQYEEIILATDMDREGEIISSHLFDIIRKKNKKVPIRRMDYWCFLWRIRRKNSSYLVKDV